MSQDTISATANAPGLHKQTTRNQSNGQSQQWKLAFERAFLARRSDEAKPDGESKHDKKAAERDIKVFSDLEKSQDFEQDRISFENAPAEEYAYDFAGSLRDLVNAIEAFHPGTTLNDLTIGAGTQQGVQHGVSTNRTRVLQTPEGQPDNSTFQKPVIENRSIRLVISGNEIQLFIRDNSINYIDAMNLINRIRSVLRETGIELSRAVLNGKEAWNLLDSDAEVIADSGDDSAVIVDKVY